MSLLAACAVPVDPLTREENALRVSQDFETLGTVAEPLTGPVTMYEAMARALKYNLDQRVKLMEVAVAEGLLDVTSHDMLPQVTATAGYTGRNVNQASTSVGSSSESISVEKSRVQADLTATWNILDFGVSYMRARQQADQVMIAEERRRKVVQTVVQNVREAYWRAVAAERLLKDIDPLMDRIEGALNDAQTIEQMRLQAPIQALRYRRGLLESLRELRNVRRDLVTAKGELAALMNLPPSYPFELDVPVQRAAPKVARLPGQIGDLERLALLSRPELKEEAYQGRISAKETKVAMLQMLPGLEFQAGYNYDSNKFLVNNDWLSYGAELTWNLLNIFTGKSSIDYAAAQEDVAEVRRLALTMAVLSQVHVASIRYLESAKEYALAAELHDIESRINDQTRASGAAGQAGDMELIQADLSAVFAALRRDLVYVDVRRAQGNLLLTMGLDPLPDVVDGTDIPTLSRALEQHLEGFDENMVRDALQAMLPETEPADQPSGGQELGPVARNDAAETNSSDEVAAGLEPTSTQAVVQPRPAEVASQELAFQSAPPVASASTSAMEPAERTAFNALFDQAAGFQTPVW